MKRRIFILLCLLLAMGYTVHAQSYPSASPEMWLETEDGESSETSYSGSAPLVAHFKANPVDMGSYTPYYEWRFYESGKEDAPFLVRYEENTDYTFQTSGSTYVKLYVTFVQGNDTIQYELDDPFSISISESSISLPNAFSPNGDGQNDVYKVKEGYKSIVSFEGYIFNRWGQKLYSWTDIDGGWDGTYNGHPVSDGVYFCLVKAKGADGKTYTIRKDVNLLRKYIEDGSSTSGN